MAVNVPLLRKVLEYVSEHPEEWYQNVWVQKLRCGTAGCIAYHAVATLGYNPIFDNDEFIGRVEAPDGHAVVISDAAADVLGLDEMRSEKLFDACNDLADLWMLAAEFTDGEIAVPEEFQDATEASDG